MTVRRLKLKNNYGKKMRAILDALANNPQATIGQLANVAGCSYSYAHKVVSSLEPVAYQPTQTQLELEQSANDKQVGGSHYKTLTIQPWDAMEAWLTPEEFRGFLKGNAIKYLARKKNADDLQKAQHYLEKLNEVS